MSTLKARKGAAKVAPPATAKTKAKKTRPTPAERLHKYSAYGDTANSCTIFTGVIHASTGYGSLGYNGKRVDAHRLSYQLANGPIPAGLCVCHRCNNRRCINPAHLYLGTRSQNAIDAVRDGRHRRKTLTTDQAREIYVRYHRDGWKIIALSEKFGVTPENIRHIAKRRRWAKATADLVKFASKNPVRKPRRHPQLELRV